MRNTVLRVGYLSGGVVTNIDFTDHEVAEVNIQTTQNYEIKFLQNRKPLMYLTSDEYLQITANIYIENNVTIDRLEELQGLNDAFLLYYDFLNNPGTAIAARVDPEISSIYSMGYEAGGHTIRLKFYETNYPAGFLAIAFNENNVGN